METAQQKHVVIIGAGPAGLTAADHALNLGHRVTVIEKKDIAGGKGSSRDWGDFVVDNGPHAFHGMTQEITDLMRRHGGQEFVPVTIKQKLYVTLKPMRYPLDMKEALTNFNLGLKIRIAWDFFAARIKSILIHQPLDSFKSWGTAHYGTALYRACFGDYSERVWGVDASQLSVEFAKRKLPNMTAFGVLWQIFTGRKKKTPNDKSYLGVKDFLYHTRGIGKIYKHLAESIQQRGGEVIYNAHIKSIDLTKANRVASVELNGPSPRHIPCDLVVSTAPVSDLTELLSPQDVELKTHAQAMPFKHGLIVNVVLKRPRFSECHWIYLVNKRFFFNRLSEPKNLSPHLAPADKTLIMLEIICGPEDPRWSWSTDQWKGPVMGDLGFFGIREEEIETIFLTKLEQAYPFYRVGYEKGKKEFLDRLGHIHNLISTGRYGLYMDIDMHDAMVLGKSAVDYALQERSKEFYDEHEVICLKKRDN